MERDTLISAFFGSDVEWRPRTLPQTFIVQTKDMRAYTDDLIEHMIRSSEDEDWS